MKKALSQKVLRYHKWRAGANPPLKILMAFVFACFTGMMAQLSINLTWTPVPLTGQSFAVMLSAVFLGVTGGLSQVMYVALGFAGIPWFANGKGGVAVIYGPTAGYLYAFIITAFLIGYCIDRYPRMRAFFPLLSLMISLHFIVILGLGSVYLWIWTKVVKGAGMDFSKLILMTVYPFIGGTIIKSALAAAIGHILCPQNDWRVR